MRVAVTVLALVAGAVAVVAQPAPSTPVAPVAGQRSAPPVPVPKSPTARFRELLAANPAERERLLARKSPAARALIEAKLQEFSSLRPDEREIRLRLAQLHDSLRPLIAVAPGQRSQLLALVATEDRPWIDERLAAWDGLTEEARRDIVESEKQLSWVIRKPDTDPKKLAEYLATLPDGSKAAAEAQMKRWLALSPDERARKTAAFSRFFDLSENERRVALQTISEPELKQMEQSLAAFSELAPMEREQCIRAFRKFAALGPEEREQFLRNAGRWQAMSPNDRAAWRRVVERALKPPSLPPFPAKDTMLATTNR